MFTTGKWANQDGAYVTTQSAQAQLIFNANYTIGQLPRLTCGQLGQEFSRVNTYLSHGGIVKQPEPAVPYGALGETQANQIVRQFVEAVDSRDRIIALLEYHYALIAQMYNKKCNCTTLPSGVVKG
jgi:hypothetical protein